MQQKKKKKKRPSAYVQNIFQPWDKFLQARGNAIPSSLRAEWASNIVQSTTNGFAFMVFLASFVFLLLQYISPNEKLSLTSVAETSYHEILLDALQTLKKTEDSLKKIQKKPSTTSAQGAVSDTDKICIQVCLVFFK